MNKKLLCAALLGGLAVTSAANAQDFDDRWYVTGSVGMNMQDNDRGTNNAPFGEIGFGKFFNPFWSFDVAVNYQNPNFEDRNNIHPATPLADGEDLNWSQYGISFDVRRHFATVGRNWNPYVLMGLGFQRSEEEFDRRFVDPRFPLPIGLGRGEFDDLDCDSEGPCERESTHGAGKLGIGIQGDMGRVGIRAELAARFDADNDSVGALFQDDDRNDGEDWFQDVLASVGVVIPLGPEPMMAVPPAPVVPSCADLDDDGDGVNNCDDQCPGSLAGQTIGPDGCPVPVPEPVPEPEPPKPFRG